ncbi:putative lipoprotein [Leptospira borgpetersenii str. Noumea 25]|nr:Phosphotransferase enzyme family protein [Leptospira borgpetersenii str. 4E]EMO09154.1 putative lipoprotein [Leptospira borgpetersenii str. Noumea 25]
MNDTELKNVLERYLSERLKGKTEIHSMVSLSGGACQENFAALIQVLDGPKKGSYDTVFRTDKESALLASLSREDEFGVCDLAYNAGVNTPETFLVGDGPRNYRKSFLLYAKNFRKSDRKICRQRSFA